MITFSAGRADYDVKMDSSGRIYYRRRFDNAKGISGTNWRRWYDFDKFRPTAFGDGLRDCINRLYQQACDCENGCTACSENGD